MDNLRAPVFLHMFRSDPRPPAHVTWEWFSNGVTEWSELNLSAVPLP